MLGTLVLASLISCGLCAGGWSTVTDSTDIQGYEQLLTGLQGDGVSGYNCPTTMIEKQVVAGLNIRYTKTCQNGDVCTIVVYERVWDQILKITSHECTAHKRQLGGLPGGYSTVTDQVDVAQYESWLTALEASGELSVPQYTVASIETQVVQGVNVKYTLTTSSGTCQIVIWDVAWLNKRTITTNTCTMNKRQLLGGYHSADLTNSQVQNCLSKSLDRINSMSNSMVRLVESQVMDAEIQIVAGANIKLQFTTMPSKCMNSGDSLGKTSDDCPVDTDSVMTGNTWSAHCYINLQGVVNLSMSAEEEPQTTNESGNSKDKPVVIKANAGLMKSKHTFSNKVELDIPNGRQLLGAKRPLLSVIRRKRDLNFLIERLNTVADKKALGNLIDEGKKLLGGGDDHDLVNHVKDLIGQDGHDLVNHYQKLLGGDNHDLVNHVSNLLGQDGHDMINHAQSLLGGDGHDLESHGKILLGGDDHDYKNHGQKMLGGDDHDYKNHGQKMLGGDDHDYKNHGQENIGGDDHDYQNHGQKILGGDDHDYKNHGQKILGGDDHDYKNHGQKMLGGDDHDYQNHGQKILGGDDHDYKNHGQKILGGDDHDYCHIGMFKDFKEKFNKLYGSAKEEEKRFMTFCGNMRTARKLQETEKGSAVYGATKFADLTKEEFKQYVGKQWDQTANEGMKKAAIPRGNFPESFDWRDHGAVTPVKNQGSCGSCWAFSTTGNIEGQWAIKKKKLVSLSEQELVDCDKIDEGCNGGLPSNAYKEIERLGGLETETDYAYKGEDEKCLFNKTDVKVFINDSVSISSDENEMASWLAANGPISIGINAFAMQFYMGGISHPWKIFCNPGSLDHGVLIVGYGVQDSEPYWIVKNSWGPDWGEKGYYLVYRGSGVCGLNTMCTSAVVD